MSSNKALIFIIACMYLVSCQKDKHLSISDCHYNFTDSSVAHPQNSVFSALVSKYKNQGYPGFVLCVYDSINGMWLGAAGKACLETGQDMSICNLQHSASVSKIYISTCILKLYEQGKLDINAPAKNYLPNDLPDISNINEASVKNLMNHSTGIYDFNNNPKLYADAINNPFAVKSWKDHLNRYVKGKPAVFPAGTSVQYSNTNYLLLGLIIEKVSGKSLGDAMNELLLNPYGLTETYYKSSAGYPNIPGIPNSYFEHNTGSLQNCTNMQLHFADISMGHEGIIASPRDYVLFLNKLLSGQILQPASLAAMETFNDVPNTTDKYGAGLFSFQTPSGTIIGHSGGGFGTMTFLFRILDKNRTVFFATNMGSIFTGNLSERFYKEVFYDIVAAADY